MSEFIPVPGLEEAIECCERGPGNAAEICDFLCSALREEHRLRRKQMKAGEKPQGMSELYVEYYFPNELPPKAEGSAVMRISERFDCPRNQWYVTAYVTREAVGRTAVKEKRFIRFGRKPARVLVWDAAEYELGVKFVTEHRKIFVPWEFLDIVRDSVRREMCTWDSLLFGPTGEEDPFL